MTNLGFIGLGTMGRRLVKRLLAAGYPVAGYTRTRSKAEELITAGMQWCDSPREVAQNADIIFSMVADGTALRAVTEGPDGLLAGLSVGKIYVDMSTVNPALIRELAQQVSVIGTRMLESPVSGSVSAAEAGTLIMLVGGAAEVLERVRPIFDGISQKIIHVGANGQGITIKIAINLSLPIQLIGLFEGVLLAERSGLSREAALDALLNSVITSPAMKYRAPLILNMPDEAWFNVEMMQKDLQLAMNIGRELGVPLVGVNLAQDYLAKAVEMGYGHQDFAALFHAMLPMSGIKAD